MSVRTFDALLNILRSKCQQQDTKMRPCISPAERLVVTLRYRGSGNSIKDLVFKFKRGKSTIACMILRVCEAIWKHLLRDNIPELNNRPFERIASDFEVRANFPYCIGAIDGKYIRLCNPANSGSLLEIFFSVVLLALVDSNYKFTYVDIVIYGKECDSTVFQNSKLYEFAD